MKKSDSAFPYAFEHNDPPQSGFSPGLTKREYIASKIVGVLIEKYGPHNISFIVKSSVETTDALLEELSK